MKLKFCIVFTLSVAVIACGGGGGSSPTINQQPGGGSGGGGTGGGGTGGGGTGGGGGSGGGSAPTVGGLIPGGAGLIIDASQVGVDLDVASGGTGANVSFGDIQAFGSVVLDDDVIDTDLADFTIEGVSGSQADLRQGQQVLVVTDAAGTSASHVSYRSNVKGPVSSVTIVDLTLGRADLVVLGQNVVTDASTTFSGISLADLVITDELEVSGVLDDTGQIRASYIELTPSLTEYKVTGVVANLTSTTFDVGGLTVDFSSAALQNFSSNQIAGGNVVEAVGDPAGLTSNTEFTATRVEQLPSLTIGGDALASAEGIIDQFTAADDFAVQSTPVTTDASTVFVNGDSDDLALGVRVSVEGAGDGTGPIVASRVVIQPTNAIRAEGNIEAIDVTNRSVTVLGVTFVIRDLTQLEDDSSVGLDPLTLADLSINDEVELRGYLDGANVAATRLEREDAEDRARLRGPVTFEDAFTGQFRILSVDIQGEDGITEFQDAQDNPVSQSEFHALVELGDFISARWDVFVSTATTADELSLEDDD